MCLKLVDLLLGPVNPSYGCTIDQEITLALMGAVKLPMPSRRHKNDNHFCVHIVHGLALSARLTRFFIISALQQMSFQR